jgi:hypothetical protein
MLFETNFHSEFGWHQFPRAIKTGSLLFSDGTWFLRNTFATRKNIFFILFYFFMKWFWVLPRRTLRPNWYGTVTNFCGIFSAIGDVLEVFIKCNIGRGKTINSLAGLEIDGDGSSR